MLKPERYKLSRNGIFKLLEELQKDPAGVSTICFPAALPRIEVEALLENAAERDELPEDILKAIESSHTGAVLFWGKDNRYLIIPPFPLKTECSSASCEIAPLNDLLNGEYIIGLMLVRLGEYLVAVYQGDKLLTCKAGTGLVHGRHRQGGSSAHRFERHRDKQIETFFTRVCAHAREELEPCGREIEYLIYGGTKETILEFRKQCDFFKQFDARTLENLLNIREPRRSHLPEVIREVWSSRVIRWNEEPE